MFGNDFPTFPDSVTGDPSTSARSLQSEFLATVYDASIKETSRHRIRYDWHTRNRRVAQPGRQWADHEWRGPQCGNPLNHWGGQKRWNQSRSILQRQAIDHHGSQAP